MIGSLSILSWSFCVTSAGEVVQPVALQGAYSVLATYADGIPDVLGEGWSV